ncbi:hypothetical protein P154DRAFT_289041 [Amniculicola lignicola CBS 123094]|uniref:Uncharacterized protein n=1 Tax=Amniculicola lignicola CBS 123094 TaxID=1392246 RepID=A0A6A5X0B4_9PLEO|nr:hypothetical protein P154DRAFT_289041 [Amniculicola lignicola CBS 123094]
MDRSDSGFDRSYCMKTSTTEEPTVQRSNTAPARRRKPRKTATESMIGQEMETQRPASEKQPNYQRRSTEPRRQSTASSSDRSTTKSRTRGNGSKPSSRRTSYTLVDPTRPTRHHRIKSSQTVPTVHRGVDDVLALHFRSCSLFQHPTHYSRHSGSSITPEVVEIQTNSTTTTPRPSTIAHVDSDHINPITDATVPKASDETVPTTELPCTTTHWMSHSTRKREYKRIDQANSGLRGLVRRIIPRCVSGPPPPRFYEKDQSDAGSVRRYRMDIDNEDHDEFDEKSTMPLRRQNSNVQLAVIPAPNMKQKDKKAWYCF